MPFSNVTTNTGNLCRTVAVDLSVWTICRIFTTRRFRFASVDETASEMQRPLYRIHFRIGPQSSSEIQTMYSPRLLVDVCPVFFSIPGRDENLVSVLLLDSYTSLSYCYKYSDPACNLSILDNLCSRFQQVNKHSSSTAKNTSNRFRCHRRTPYLHFLT